MPELPEVETVVRGLRPWLEGRTITRVDLNRPDLRWPFPDRFAERIAGHGIERIARRAKYIQIMLDDGAIILVHLGMSGRLTIAADPSLPRAVHDHVVFSLDDGVEVRFNDPRRFGSMDLIAPGQAMLHPLLAHLGPEPLDPGFDGQGLARRLAGRRTPIKSALLDQRTVAGLGNIYVCEALFEAGISPLRPAHKIGRRSIERLVAAIRSVLQAAIAAGGSTLRDHVQATGEPGWFQHSFAVYGRAGSGCRGCTCDPDHTGGVVRTVQSGRSSFHCPRRQR